MHAHAKCLLNISICVCLVVTISKTGFKIVRDCDDEAQRPTAFVSHPTKTGNKCLLRENVTNRYVTTNPVYVSNPEIRKNVTQGNKATKAPKVSSPREVFILDATKF